MTWLLNRGRQMDPNRKRMAADGSRMVLPSIRMGRSCTKGVVRCIHSHTCLMLKSLVPGEDSNTLSGGWNSVSKRFGCASTVHRSSGVYEAMHHHHHQWVFKQCHNAMSIWDISIRWAPGHTGIEGNEAADALAEAEAQHPQEPEDMASGPSSSGILWISKKELRSVKMEWWTMKKEKLSRWYRDWGLSYDTKAPSELTLPRHTLQRLLAIRSSHGDFAWYHKKFCHEDAKLQCSCGLDKTPDHMVHCRRARRLFAQWPNWPLWPPTNCTEGLAYLSQLIQHPQDFADFLQVTGFYTKICTR